MEWEKIVYFYPLAEYTGTSGRGAAAKKYWFQDASLKTCFLYEDNDGRRTGAGSLRTRKAEFQVIGCAVPPYYYRRRLWKPQALSEAMEAVVCRVEGMADTWLQPQVGAMLTEEYVRRWAPRAETVQAVVKRLVDRYADDVMGTGSGAMGTSSRKIGTSGRVTGICGAVTVLLGDPADTEQQMQMTRELLLPYLPRINRLLIFYEEVAETDIWLELGSHLDEYYYEYGLVPQLVPYVRDCAEVLRCGKTKCDGMILDYRRQFCYPKIRPESTAVYIDMRSDSVKERLLGRKTPHIPYISPLKYLDTMVKNSYDVLVIKT